MRGWTDVRNADQFGPRCMQRTGPMADYWFRSNGMSEDCLYLNVWTPAKSGGEKLPVLVYVFGGGFQNGDGSEPRYDGESMARKGIVAVTLNYRTNVFGFFSHPELTRESPQKASGQLRPPRPGRGPALGAGEHRRLRRRPDARHDRRRVRGVALGERAHGLAPLAQTSSPVRSARAAPSSRPCRRGRWRRRRRTAAASARRPARPRSPRCARCPPRSSRRSWPPRTTRRPPAAARARRARPGCASAPNLDGYFLPKTLAQIYEAGEQAKIPLLAGSNSEEMPARVVLGQSEPTPEGFAEAVRKIYGESAEQVLKVYAPKTTDEVLQAATDLASARFIALRDLEVDGAAR